MAKPPKHLGPRASKFWTDLHENYTFSIHEAVLVDTICDTLDRHERAVAELAKAGLTEPTEFGAKQHPAAAIADRAANTLRALLKQLNLPAPQAQKPRAGNNVRHIRGLK